MAATAHIPAQVSMEEYLHTVYKPDCDYVDGEIEERAVGEYDHATWQTMIAAFFTARQAEWGIKARTELRVRVAPRRVRVPDVCLLSREVPIEQVITHPPLAMFEILSPDDRMIRVMNRLRDFEQMGVGAIWLINPFVN